MLKKSVNYPSLCIFANFFIDNEERLQRMKDSFQSFCAVRPEEWRVNIRGRLKHVAGEFLLAELGDNLDLHFIESNTGWLRDSYSIMKEVQSDFVLFWIEDHICLENSAVIRDVLYEMSHFSVDQLWYSWFHNRTWNTFSHIPIVAEGDCIVASRLDYSTAKMVRESLGRDFYVVSAVSIMKKEFFLKVLASRRPFLKRWPKLLPFDFEKKSADCVAPSIIWALPKKELFVAIDDDHGNHGYSLISRGLYPERIKRSEMKALDFGLPRRRQRLLFIPSPIRILLIKLYYTVKRFGYSLSYLYK